MPKKHTHNELHMDIIYECHLSSREVEPVIGVSCSLVKKPKLGYDTVYVTWEDGTLTSERAFIAKPVEYKHRSVAMRVRVKFDSNPPWPRDAAVWFQVFAKVKSSEGHWIFEKAGAGVLHLGNLVPEFVKASRNFMSSASRHKHSPLTIKSHPSNSSLVLVEVPLFLQSMRVSSDTPVNKGKIIIQASALSASDFAPPSKYDLVPGNMKYLESSMMALVKKNLMVFKPEVHAQFRKTFRPTSPNLERVHAPLYITAAGILPGEYYWANFSGETDYDEEAYLSVAKAVLQRNRVSQKQFASMVKSMTVSSSFDPMTHGKAAQLMGEMTSAMATTLYYIADLADVNDDRTQRYFRKQKSHITVESFDDAKERGGDDCEGLARVNARTFKGFSDGKFRSQLLRNVQDVARRYIGAGTLGSVTSRNISEANGGLLRIDSADDNAAEVGAHMWFTLFPKKHFLEMVARTSPSTRDSIRWTDGSTIGSRPSWEHQMPVMISEGTGLFHPAPLAADAYHKSTAEKTAAVNRSLVRRDAYTRLFTNCTLLELKNGSASPDEPGELGKLQILRRQQTIVSDPDTRTSTFYRRMTGIYPVVSTEAEPVWNSSEAQGEIPVSWGRAKTDDFKGRIRMGDTCAPVYSWRSLVPVQVAARPRTFAGVDNDSESQKGYDMEWGVNTTDMLHKRSFVGLLRLGAASSEQEKIISSYARHLPPQSIIKGPSAAQRAVFDRKIQRYNDILRSVAFGGGNALTDKEFFSTLTGSPLISPQGGKHGPLYITTGFLKMKDATSDKLERIGLRLKKCPYAVDARAVGELFDSELGNVRIEVAVSVNEPARLDDSAKPFKFPFDGQV